MVSDFDSLILVHLLFVPAFTITLTCHGTKNNMLMINRLRVLVPTYYHDES